MNSILLDAYELSTSHKVVSFLAPLSSSPVRLQGLFDEKDEGRGDVIDVSL